MRKKGLDRGRAAPGRRSAATGTPSVPSLACDECRIVQEADHRIANDLSLLAGFVRLKAADMSRQRPEPEARDVLILLESIRNQIESIAHLHRSLSRNGPKASTDLGERLHDICASLAAIDSIEARLVEDFAPGVEAPSDQILPLTQIVAEVVTNAMKYGRRPGQVGRIVVRCRKDETGAIMIEVVDDGPGFPPEFDVAKDGGLGFRIIQALARQLGAHVTFDLAYRGLSFRLVLPPAAAPDL